MPRLFKSSWILLVASAAGCSSGAPFKIRFADWKESRQFSCEEQSVHPKSRPTVRPVESPGRTSITLEAGDATVLWLYHFEDDGESLKDADYAYTIAIELRDVREGRWELPAKEVGLTFFCDNWGSGYKAAELRAVKGMLRLTSVEGAIEGEFEATFEGYRERKDRSREATTLVLSGRFRAR